MRKISQEEAEKLQTHPMGKYSKVRLGLMSLKPGEFLLIEKQDWKQKRQGPSHLIRRMERASQERYECRKLANGSGWVVQRLK